MLKISSENATGVASRFYAPQIDGLRFFAALLVIIHHSAPVPGLELLKDIGWLGVDLFLCISGFLLTRLLALEIERTGHVRVRYFFVRRALRIWPLYFLYSAFMSAVAVIGFGVSAKVSAGWMLSHLSFSANILTALKGFSPVPFTAHLWTISLEEQAYFVLPFLLLAMSRSALPQRTLLNVTVMVLLVLAAARLAFWSTGVPMNQIFVTPLRGDGLVVGAAAALLVDRGVSHRSPKLAWAVAAFIFAAYLLVAVSTSSTLAAFHLYPLLMVGCGFLLLGAIAKPSWLGNKGLAYLGKISFGIYVYHRLVIYLVEGLMETSGFHSPTVSLLLIVICSSAAASLSYHVYEVRFLRLKDRFAVVPSRPV